jgi:hypothetical protein
VDPIVTKNIASRVARWYVFKQKNPNLGIHILKSLGMENIGVFGIFYNFDILYISI